jgi:hypothetical protein
MNSLQIRSGDLIFRLNFRNQYLVISQQTKFIANDILAH